MQQLEQLTRQARALGCAEAAPDSAEAEVARQMQICNACRYCEGFCAVFPAMTRRLAFPVADVHYLANLCHSCGACLHSCQYSPPHEFAVNVPQAMAKLRLRTYTDFAWPRVLGTLYARNGLTLALATALGLTSFLWLALWARGTLWLTPSPGNFYAIFPHNLMVALFSPVFLFAMLALSLGVHRFWREISPTRDNDVVAGTRARAVVEATHDALRLKYLDGGHGEGCNNEDDAWTQARRTYHHFTFYGFILCFAATSLGTLYHYLWNWEAPYDLPSLPKLLGATGGVSLLVGTVGLWYLNLRRYPQHGDAMQKPMDRGFIALLFFIALTGMGLWWARNTPALPGLLALHLGCVMSFFLTMPYGKFAHGVFRGAALLKWAIERNLPNKLKLGDN